MPLFNFKIKKKNPSELENQLEYITNLLFPKLKLIEDVDRKGKKVKFYLDNSIDSNLYAAIVDLQEGFNDQKAQETLINILDKLKILKKHLEITTDKIDQNVEYFMVEMDNKTSLDDEDITTKET